ncbi:MAG: CpsB/CapC family capsule biosynthesis tyrosine phosphatase [Eubacterium sp.]
MKGITDIHSHIMFQVDDGARTIQESIEMLKAEYEQGVRAVVLTPHYHAGKYMPKTEVIEKRFEQLQTEIRDIIPEMKLYLGNEIMSFGDMVDMLQQGYIRSLAESSYVLVEFYPFIDYSIMEKSLNLLLLGGYIPIVAHCERYKCLRAVFKGIHWKNINHLVEMGAYMQVNVTSVFGKDSKFVSRLIDNDFLHFVASDAHNLGRRGIYWDECVKYLKKKYNTKYIEWLLVENPNRVIAGEYI